MDEKLRNLMYELDAELDGVTLPASACAIVNAIRETLDSELDVVQIDVISDEDANEAMYVDGKLKNDEGTIYVCDLVSAADGKLVDLRRTNICWVHEEWPDSLQDALACVEEP